LEAMATDEYEVEYEILGLGSADWAIA